MAKEMKKKSSFCGEMKKNCPVWGGKNHRRFQKKEQRRLCRVFSPMEIERLEYRRKERRRHRIKTVRAKPRQRFVTFEGEYTLQKILTFYKKIFSYIMAV